MKVVIRADSSAAIGIGHLARCHALARALRVRGVQVSFVCREHSGNIADCLSKDGFAVKLLAAPSNPMPDARHENYGSWLGVSQQQDARETFEALAGHDTKICLVVDHYALDAEWESTLRPFVSHIVVIDDLASRPHDADLLLDQNAPPNDTDRYCGLIDPGCRLLLGPGYVLLRSEFLQYRELLPERDGSVQRVLLYFGGTDQPNLTARSLSALCAPRLAHLEVHVVVGANCPHQRELAELARHRPGTHLHAPSPHLAELMSRADLAVGAGGTTTWERLCLGLPSIVVSVAENQKAVCEALANLGAIRYLGNAVEVGSEHIQAELDRLLDAPGDLQKMARLGVNMVDGLGVERVCDELMALVFEPKSPGHNDVGVAK